MQALLGDKSLYSVAAQVDKALGYPKPGVNVGGGVHVVPPAGATTTHCEVIANKDGTFCYPVKDDYALKALAGLKLTPVEVSYDQKAGTWITTGSLKLPGL